MTEQERASITRKVDARLLEEIERLRAEVKRWQREFRGYAVHDDARCEYYGKCQCGLAELLAECEGSPEWLAREDKVVIDKEAAKDCEGCWGTGVHTPLSGWTRPCPYCQRHAYPPPPVQPPAPSKGQAENKEGAG